MIISAQKPYTSAATALEAVKSGDRVYIHGMGAFPQILVDAMVARASELKDVEIVHLHTEGDASYSKAEYQSSFKLNNFFIGANVRQAVDQGRADYIPVFLSEIPALFRRGKLPLDIALISVTPPDAHGYCSLGVSVDIAVSAVQTAKIVIAQVNRHMPRTRGEGNIHCSHFTYMVEGDSPLVEHVAEEPGEVETIIGQKIASLIEDGSTLQTGIGAIPNAALAALKGHKRLGLHTEMFSDGVIDLVEMGVITNECKPFQKGRSVAGFVSGSKRLYDFVNDNPGVEMMDIAYVNDTSVIRRLPKMIALNSAVEIDVTGQVCADSIGRRIYSGVGGQMDFVRGASLSEGGKPIFAIPSVTRRGESRIVSMLKPGAGVVTTRAHVHYVVTEYGIADLYGKNLAQRAKELIAIAHPDHREALEKSAYTHIRA